MPTCTPSSRVASRVASLARAGRSSLTRRQVSATKCSEQTYARYSPSFVLDEVDRLGLQVASGRRLHMCYCNCCAPVLHRRTCSGSARSRRPSHLHLGHLAVEATPADAGAARAAACGRPLARAAAALLILLC